MQWSITKFKQLVQTTLPVSDKQTPQATPDAPGIFTQATTNKFLTKLCPINNIDKQNTYTWHEKYFAFFVYQHNQKCCGENHDKLV